MALNGRKSWSRAQWVLYVSAPKLATEVRRRLELARLEAAAGMLPAIVDAAERRLGELEDDAPAPVKDEAPAPGSDEDGSWWW